MMKKLYIAETNADGHIECVWMARSIRRKVMMFNPKKHRFDPTEPADFSGAGEYAIASWLAAAQITQE